MKNSGLLLIKSLLVIFVSLFLNGCLHDNTDTEINQNEGIESLVIPEDFNFSTIKNVEVELTAPLHLAGSIFEIYRKHSAEDTIGVCRGVFDRNAHYSMIVNLPTYVDTIQVISKYIGLEERVVIPIVGEKAVYDYNIHLSEEDRSIEKSMDILKSSEVASFKYLGNYNAQGFPSYLFKVNDHAWESLLVNMNQTLPEGKSVLLNKPHFLASGTQTNLVLKEGTNVYVTFAAEGSSQTSALGYFIYNGSKPDDNGHIIIFPNASEPGSGGALHSGDQVHLGYFPANTVIGWFIVPAGWNSKNKIVSDTKGLYYSMPQYNPESSAQNKQHMVFLKDAENEVVVLGFEESNRDLAATDNDFNDLVFYITLDKITSADLSNAQATTSAVDTDGDGVIDSLDEYPIDPNKAFDNKLGSGSSGTLAFEDLWPSKGDYDFNDLVVYYSFRQALDASNLIKSMGIDLIIRNKGGSYRNGLAFELPVSSSAIQKVTGSVLSEGYVQLSSNGTESGVGNAVIFGFDNIWNLNSDTVRVEIEFVNGIKTSVLGTFPFNPFMVVDGDRSREVHLADLKPTSKASSSMFGTYDDYSSASSGRYYKSKQNMPWGLNIYGSYAIPKEKSQIIKGHLRFSDWATSGGTNFQDWYLNMSGYRNPSFLK